MATILTKKKDTTGAPATGDLTNSSGGAELAVNTADKRLYTKNSSNAVVEIGTNPGTAVTFVAGTASDPAITTTGDTNTGIFFPAADTIAFAEGGAEAMRIDSAGEVLVGGTTAISSVPGALSIQRTTNAILSLFRNDGSISSGNVFGSILFLGADTTSNTPTTHAYIEAAASGTHAAGDNPTRLAFGCTNDNSGTVAEFASLEGGVSTRTFVVKQPTLTNEGQAEIYSAGGTAGTINRYAAISVYKHSGITNACGYLGLSAEDAAFNYLWADNSDVLRISTSGAHVGTTSGTVVGTQTSDERLKDILGPVTYGLNEVLAIEPIAFTMKDDPSLPKIGFSAQQVQPIVPEAVYDTKECIDGYTENEETKEQTPNSDRTKLAMEYTQLIPVLVNAVKELKAELDTVKAELATLKGN
jgi:hypothetical protein